MKIIHTHEDRPDNFDSMQREFVYNALDCLVTLDVHDQISRQLDNHTAATYNFSKELQGPVLEMRLRGVRIDQARKEEVIDEYFEHLDVLERNLDRIVFEGIGLPTFNWRSNPDLHRLFYDRLGIPVIKKRGRPSVDRDALEKMEAYLIARPIVSHLLAMRDIGKKISRLRTAIDPDGRMRTSYNIAGTDTGRFSSSYSEFGTGGNLQNIEEALRSIFISDKGMKFAKFDAKSGESYVVGAIEWNLFRDARYLEACESGDPHTAVARICWPRLSWTGNLKRDKDIAEQPYYRHYSYRFMCKKLGHGSNYGGKPQTLSTQTKLPISVVHDFQPKYFIAFPAHSQWHGWVERELRKTGYLVSLMGRKRWFFGRRNDDSTLRAAIAYDPQGSLADIVNRAMLRIWRQTYHPGPLKDVALMMQDHDALTFMYPEEQEDEIIPKLISELREPIELSHNRVLEIPYDAKVGWNKGEYCCGNKSDPKCKECRKSPNPDGLRDWVPGDTRKRRPEVHILDRHFR